MVTEYLDVDVAHALAEFQGQWVDVGVAVLVTMEDRKVVWESPIGVPLILEDWLERCCAHLATLRAQMKEAGDWQLVEAQTNWWMREPGDDERWPYGLECR